MALAKIIEEIIENYRSPDSSRVSETILDKKGQTSVMERIIDNKKGLPYCLLRFDTNPKVLFPYFKEGQNLRRMCDYILFTDSADGRSWCLLIELKKGKEDAKPQLEAGKAFAQFLITAAERVGKPISSTNVIFRKIRVGENEHLRPSQRTATPEYDKNGYLNLQTDALHLRYLLR